MLIVPFHFSKEKTLFPINCNLDRMASITDFMGCLRSQINDVTTSEHANFDLLALTAFFRFTWPLRQRCCDNGLLSGLRGRRIFKSQLERRSDDRCPGRRELHVRASLSAPCSIARLKHIRIGTTECLLLFRCQLDHSPVGARCSEAGKDLSANAKIGMAHMF